MLGLIEPKARCSEVSLPPAETAATGGVPCRSAQIDWDYPITVWNVVSLARIAHTGWFRTTSVVNPRELLKLPLSGWNVELHHRQIGNYQVDSSSGCSGAIASTGGQSYSVLTSLLSGLTKN